MEKMLLKLLSWVIYKNKRRELSKLIGENSQHPHKALQYSREYEEIKNTVSSISDGYHTFGELYEFRMVYNSALFNEWYINGKYDVHKSRRHHDGELCFGQGDYFVVVAMLPEGQITNHYKMEYWDLFKCKEEDKTKYEFDGHTAKDVLVRLKGIGRANGNENI